jgi:hypothetical protein
MIDVAVNNVSQIEIAVPDQLTSRVMELLNETPTLSWDAALAKIAAENGDRG